MPEFLTEKNWESDFINNEKWIFGIYENCCIEKQNNFKIKINKLIESSYVNKKIKYNDIIYCSTKEAEILKLIKNTFLSTKVTYFNEIFELSQKLNINYDNVIELVKTDKNGMKSVSYAGLTPYLVQAIKQQQAQINELKTKSGSVNQVEVDVIAELAKANAITINGDLVINGKVEFSSANKGVAKIKLGETKIKVDLPKNFNDKPNVVISPINFIDGAYRTTNVTINSFEIELNKTQAEDVEFNWQAF